MKTFDVLTLVSNKEKIAEVGGIKPLIALAASKNIGVSIEAVAALANLAVNGIVVQLHGKSSHFGVLDANELAIANEGGLEPIIDGATSDSLDLQSQCARALRNLSVNRKCIILICKLMNLALNKKIIVDLGGIEALRMLVNSHNDRICQQSHRALVNLGYAE